MDLRLKGAILAIYILLAAASVLSEILTTTPPETQYLSSRTPSLAVQVVGLFSSFIASRIDPYFKPDDIGNLWVVMSSALWPTANPLTSVLFLLPILWVRLQFYVMEYMALESLFALSLYIPYQLAVRFVKPARHLSLAVCRRVNWVTEARAEDCVYCWGEIRAGDPAVEHIKCKTIFHERCFQEWLTKDQQGCFRHRESLAQRRRGSSHVVVAKPIRKG